MLALARRFEFFNQFKYILVHLVRLFLLFLCDIVMFPIVRLASVLGKDVRTATFAARVTESEIFECLQPEEFYIEPGLPERMVESRREEASQSTIIIRARRKSQPRK